MASSVRGGAGGIEMYAGVPPLSLMARHVPAWCATGRAAPHVVGRASAVHAGGVASTGAQQVHLLAAAVLENFGRSFGSSMEALEAAAFAA